MKTKKTTDSVLFILLLTPHIVFGDSNSLNVLTTTDVGDAIKIITDKIKNELENNNENASVNYDLLAGDDEKKSTVFVADVAAK